MRWKALAEIYTMHSFAQLCNRNFFQMQENRKQEKVAYPPEEERPGRIQAPSLDRKLPSIEVLTEYFGPTKISRRVQIDYQSCSGRYAWFREDSPKRPRKPLLEVRMASYWPVSRTGVSV